MCEAKGSGSNSPAPSPPATVPYDVSESTGATPTCCPRLYLSSSQLSLPTTAADSPLPHLSSATCSSTYSAFTSETTHATSTIHIRSAGTAGCEVEIDDNSDRAQCNRRRQQAKDTRRRQWQADPSSLSRPYSQPGDGVLVQQVGGGLVGSGVDGQYGASVRLLGELFCGVVEVIAEVWRTTMGDERKWDSLVTSWRSGREQWDSGSGSVSASDGVLGVERRRRQPCLMMSVVSSRDRVSAECSLDTCVTCRHTTLPISLTLGNLAARQPYRHR